MIKITLESQFTKFYNTFTGFNFHKLSKKTQIVNDDMCKPFLSSFSKRLRSSKSQLLKWNKLCTELVKVNSILSMFVILTSGGVVILGDRRSMLGLEETDRGDRSIERREFCKGDGESDSDLATPLVGLLTLGVAGDAL